MANVKYARSAEELASARQPEGMWSFRGKETEGAARIASRALLGAAAGVVVATVVLLLSNPQGFSADQFEAGGYLIISGFFAYFGAVISAGLSMKGGKLVPQTNEDVTMHFDGSGKCWMGSCDSLHQDQAWDTIQHRRVNDQNLYFDELRKDDDFNYHYSS